MINIAEISLVQTMGGCQNKPFVDKYSAAKETVVLMRCQQGDHPWPVILTSLAFIAILAASCKSFFKAEIGPLGGIYLQFKDERIVTSISTNL
jgi:hypothetical protein